MSDLPSEALAALERHFGHRKFLDGQAAIVSALLEGRDVLAVLPTGGGKSLCFQLPALMMQGVTVVVSPLIALMKDQVDGLERRGIPATLINSTMGASEQQRRIAELRAGRWKLVYVAPERFRQRSFVEALRSAGIGMLAVDEAHCISQWGHDFRPDYQRLGEAIERLGNPQLAAFTATATPTVRSDILRQLRLRDPFECVQGFSRPNLSLNATPCPKVRDKYERLKAVLDEHRTGVIYCATRSKVEEVHEQLRDWNIKAGFYHAGMSEDARAEAQERFIAKRDSVVVATNAFGMGIDRPDVRFVVHFEIPGSLEAYYQEAGRAGRDGGPGWCEVLFNYADTRTQEFFIEGNNPGFATIVDLYETLRARADREGKILLSIDQITEAAGLKNSMAVGSALATLSRAGYIDRYDVPGQRIRGTSLLRPEIHGRQLELNRQAMDEKEKRDRDKLARVIAWAYDNGCRQKFILNYFGEAHGRECGTCDRCRANHRYQSATGKTAGPREATEAELTLVRKVLSGVARCSRRLPQAADGSGGWEGRFGRAKIIGMLTGSRAKEIAAAGLDQLSTHGILQNESQPKLQNLFRELESAGLLTTSSGEYPLVTLTPSGEALMKNGGPLRLNWHTLDSAAGSTGNSSAKPGGKSPSSSRTHTGDKNAPRANSHSGFGSSSGPGNNRTGTSRSASSPSPELFPPARSKSKTPGRAAATSSSQIPARPSSTRPASQTPASSSFPAAKKPAAPASQKSTPPGRTKAHGIGMSSLPSPSSSKPPGLTPSTVPATSPSTAPDLSPPTAPRTGPAAGPLSVSFDADDTGGPGFDEVLYKKLRDLRASLAARDGVPPFAIFNNQTLEYLTRLRPVTPAAGRRIRGISDTKAARYLQSFLDTIAGHV